VKVVLTREAGKNDELRGWLPEGAEVDEVPLTETRYVEASVVERDLRTAPHYGHYEALVITSARVKDYVAMSMAAMAEGAVVLSVGPATTRALHEEGVDVAGEARSRSLDLLRYVERGPVLMVGAREMREELMESLRASGFEVDHVACYETRPVALSAEQAAVLRSAQVVVIGAPSAWSVARDCVTASTWVVVPGVATHESVVKDHPRVLKGWGPTLRDALATLAD
jgi:uroporphyrinogen-III synthase